MAENVRFRLDAVPPGSRFHAGALRQVNRVLLAEFTRRDIGGVLVTFVLLIALNYPAASTALLVLLLLLVYLALIFVVERIGRNEQAQLAGERSET